MTTEKFVETSVTVKLSNRIHPVDDISLTYPFGMEIQMTTGYVNGTFDTRWENDQISFQGGMYFFPWYWDLFTGHWLKIMCCCKLKLLLFVWFFLHKDLPGTVCSIATINSREKDSQGPWKIAVAYRTSEKSPLATNLLEFEVTMDILNGKLNII